MPLKKNTRFPDYLAAINSFYFSGDAVRHLKNWTILPNFDFANQTILSRFGHCCALLPGECGCKH